MVDAFWRQPSMTALIRQAANPMAANVEGLTATLQQRRSSSWQTHQPDCESGRDDAQAPGSHQAAPCSDRRSANDPDPDGFRKTGHRLQLPSPPELEVPPSL